MPSLLFSHTLYLAALCLGIMASFRLPETGWWGLWAAALLAVSAWTVYGARRNRLGHFQAAFALACALLGAAYGVARTQMALNHQWTVADSAQSVLLRVQVTGLPERDELGRTRFVGIGQTEGGRSYRLLFADYAARDWRVGEVWRVKARVKAAIGTRNAVGFDREAWALANGLDGTASLAKERFRLPEQASGVWFNRWREDWASRWQDAAARYSQGAGLMRALALGDKSGVSAQTWAAVRPLGLNHLLSISGLHVGMVGWLAAWLATLLLRVLPRVPQSPRVWTSAVGFAAAVVYAGLAGFDVPALRSVLMIGVFALAWARHRQAGSWHTWWTAMTVVLLWQPAAALSAGFWLSFGLVGALIWATAGRKSKRDVLVYIQHDDVDDDFRLPELTWRDKLRIAASAQWAATLLGGVATIALFGLLPIFSPLANAVAIPLFSWLLVPLALLASALPFAAPKLAAAWLGEQTVAAIQWAGERLPEMAFAHAPAPLLWLALAGALVLLLPRGTRIKPLACCALAAFALYRPPAAVAHSGSLKITVWDVGQGLSVLLQTASQNILYDSGTANAAEMALLPNLRAAGITHLDVVIASHHDDDHDGGLPAVQQRYPDAALWAGQPENYPRARYCQSGTTWTADGVYFEWLTLPHSADTPDNDASCVLRVIAGSHALLITGDLSARGEAQLIAQYGDALQSDVLVLGHHGSKSSSSGAFVNRVAPRWAIASSGFANAYRHPHPDVINRLAAHGVTLLRTDTQGAWVITLAGDEASVAQLARAKYWWQKKPFNWGQ
nr:DNA internalization-related competence protein ComEC/Rec2 [uncultured Kingella sp.]